MKAAAKVILALTTALLSSCTALYLFNSDEENLLCGPEDVNGTPRCKDGFVCIDAPDGKERCVKAGFKEEGEACIDSGECIEGVCADVYADRCDGDVVLPEHELDCAKRDQADRGLRCRRPCNDDFLCGEGQRCFAVEGLDPFCQQGTCATDSDCVAGISEGLCVEEGLNGGRSGLCRKACDPLECNDNDGGAGCACGADENCATPPDEGVSARAVCLPIGAIGAGLTCDAANVCAAGATCVLRNDGTQLCEQWCRAGAGGAPACDAGSCASLGDVRNPALGICQ